MFYYPRRRVYEVVIYGCNCSPVLLLCSCNVDTIVCCAGDGRVAWRYFQSSITFFHYFFSYRVFSACSLTAENRELIASRIFTYNFFHCFNWRIRKSLYLRRRVLHCSRECPFESGTRAVVTFSGNCISRQPIRWPCDTRYRSAAA